MAQDQTASRPPMVLRRRRRQTARLFPGQLTLNASLAPAIASRDSLALVAAIEPAWAVPSQSTSQHPLVVRAKLPNAWVPRAAPERGSSASSPTRKHEVYAKHCEP